MHTSINCASALAAVLDAILWSKRTVKNIESTSFQNTCSDTATDNEDVDAIFLSKHAVKNMECDSWPSTCSDTATDNDEDVESVVFEEILIDKLWLPRSAALSSPTTMSPPSSEPGTPRQLSPLDWERSNHTPRAPASRATARAASAPCGIRCRRIVISETHTEILVNGIVIGPIPVV